MKGARPGPGSLSSELRLLAEGRGREWYRIASELDFAESLREAFPGESARWESILHGALEALLVAARRGADGADAVAAAERALEPIASVARTFTVHCIGHAHLDMNWQWPWNDTVLTCRNMFATVHALMEEFPDFRFSQSQAALYDAMERYSPATADRIRSAIRRGQWEVTASAWVEGDRNLPCGESLVRQFLFSRRYLADAWGVSDAEVRVDWSPDTFGHAASVPQVLAKSGFTGCYLCRGAGTDRAFRWRGIDGSEVVVWNDAAMWYLGTVTPTDLSVVVDHFGKTGLRDYPMVYGVGDHGGGPTREHLLALQEMASWPVFPRIVFSTAHAFFDTLEEHRETLPVVEGELNGVFEGCYTSQARMKGAHRDAENRLLTAESLSALAATLVGLPYPAAILRQAWLETLFNQFHDILPGSGVPDTYHYALASLQNTRAATDVATREATAAIVPFSPAAGPGERLAVVFNPLPHRRTEAVVVDVFECFLAGTILEVLDPEGRPVAHQSRPGALHDIPYLRVAFTARNVPGWGYHRYLVRSSHGARAPGKSPGSPPPEAGVQVLRNDARIIVVRNEHFRIAIEPGSGAISSIHDLALDRELVPQGRRASLLAAFRECPHQMSSWEIGQIAERTDLLAGASVNLEDSGPARVTVRSQQQWGRSTMTQYTTLAAGVPRIDFRLVVDWHERGDERTGVPGLLVSFPFDFSDASATHDIPFGAIRGPMDGCDVPALTWVDVSGSCADGTTRGLTLANNGRHGFVATDRELCMRVLRSAYEPDLEPDQGLHEVGYALAPHAGPCDEHACGLLGRAFNHPLVPAVGTTAAPGLPASTGLLEVESDAVICSAVKPAEKGDTLMLRLFETRGRRAEAMLRFGFGVASVRDADLLERATGPALGMAGSCCALSLKPFEIRTLLVTRRSAGTEAQPIEEGDEP